MCLAHDQAKCQIASAIYLIVDELGAWTKLAFFLGCRVFVYTSFDTFKCLLEKGERIVFILEHHRLHDEPKTLCWGRVTVS